MSRDRLTRMDISTSIDDEPKFRRLAGAHPDLYADAFTAYVCLCAASWRNGSRLTAGEGWPLLLTLTKRKSGGHDTGDVVDALREVDLLDDDNRIPVRAWDNWYVAAAERVRLAHERYARYNAKRGLLSTRSSLQANQPTNQPAISNHVVNAPDEYDALMDGLPPLPLSLPLGSDAVGASG